MSRDVGAGAAWTRTVRATVLVLLGLAAGAAFTAPLLRHFRDAIPYAYGVSPERRVQGLVPGDQLQFYYYLAVTDDMVRGRVPWFRDPYQFSAPRPSNRRSFFFLPFSLLFAALAPLGRATAYNALVWLSFPATAASGFLLAGRFGADRVGAALTAAVLTLLPYRLASLAGGHPTGVTFFLLPLALYFLEAAWQERSRIAAAAAGASVVCLAANEPHFLYFFVFLMPLWLLFALWRLEPDRRPGDLAGVAAWLASSALGPTVAVAVHAMRHEAATWTAPGVLGLFVVAWLTLLATWRVTAEVRARAGEEAWRSEARGFAPLLVLALYGVSLAWEVPHLGAALAVCAVVGVVAAKRATWRAAAALARRAPYRDLPDRLLGLWLVAAGIVAAAGLMLQYKASFIDPSGQGGGRSLREIALFAPRPIDFVRRSSAVLTRELYPGAATAALAVFALRVREGRALVALALVFAALALGPHAPQWLPLYGAAFHLVPFFGIIRQPAKLFSVTAVALAVAAGVGTTVLGRRLGRRGRAGIACAGIAAILFDFSSVLPFGLTKLPQDNAAYREIAARGTGSNLLELPLWPGDSAFSSIYQYWSTRTRVPTVNGYSATAPPGYVDDVYRPLESMNLGAFTAAQGRRLDELRVRLVTLHRDTYPPQVSLYPYRFALAAMRADPNLRPVAADDGVFLFERVPGPHRPWPQTVPWPMGAFFEAESLRIGAGERVADGSASGGAFVRGGAGADLPLVYGPYRPVPSGRFEVRFRARGAGRVEVSAERGRSILASAVVDRGDWEEVPLELSLDRPRTIELRAWGEAAGERRLDVDWVLVRKTDGIGDGSGPRRFEAEDLTALYGVDRESAAGSGGAYAVIVDYPPGAVVRDGPYRSFGPGRLRVAVRSRRGALGLRVESADGRHRYADVVVPSHRSWQTVEEVIDLPRRSILCTRLVSRGAESDVDYVEITAAARRAP